MNNMAHLNHKGEIELTEEDRNALNGRSKDKKWATNIVNKIIWGQSKHFYNDKLLEENK
jgi:hypothetical protein